MKEVRLSESSQHFYKAIAVRTLDHADIVGYALNNWSPNRGPTACIMRPAAIFIIYVYTIKMTL